MSQMPFEQIEGQIPLESAPGYATEHLPGARRDATGKAHGKVVILHPTTNGCDLMLPPGVVGHVHRVADGKAHVNLVVDLSDELVRCPVHGIPDCSPLLNGCTRLTRA